MKCHKELKNESVGPLTNFLANLQIIISNIVEQSVLKGLKCDNYNIICGINYKKDDFDMYRRCINKTDIDKMDKKEQIAHLAYSLGFGSNNLLAKKVPLPSLVIVLHQEDIIIRNEKKLYILLNNHPAREVDNGALEDNGVDNEDHGK